MIGTVCAQDERTWAGMEVRPLPQLEAWKVTIWLLALATSVLVVTTVRAAAVMQRGATELRSALTALSRDLKAPIPRSPLRELSDVADGIAGLVESLAEARREEARLARELSKNERLAALGRVAAGVAHEVRNPLASIKLRLDLAGSVTRLPPEVERAIHHATSEIERLDRLVADLLVVAGRSTGPRAPLSLGQLARTRSEALAPWAAERHVEFRVQGDARVAGARRFARPRTGQLAAQCRGGIAGARRVQIEVDQLRGVALLAVCDAGEGVAEMRHTELFEPFFTTKPGGTGLGLPLARSIARAHGGDVRYSRVAHETCFELELPLAPEGEPLSEPRLRAPGRRHANDESRLCADRGRRAGPARRPGRRRERLGCSSLGAPGVAEARRLLQEAPVDCILLDIRLKDGDGLDLLAELRAGPAGTSP
ncbi:MAG: histidine kinase dimerization/phospho-acceptor domain-containing protein [Polyangiaceae bacterium]